MCTAACLNVHAASLAVPQVIRGDNQKNAVLAVKVFYDLHKSFRNVFEPQFMAFVEFVAQVG